MKRLLIALMLVLAMVGLASAGTKPITFNWQQNAADLPNLASWNILYSFSTGGPYTQLVNVPYSGTPQTEYTKLAPVSVVGDGLKKVVYFTANAVGRSGQISAFSNEVSTEIDFTVVTVPIQLRITIGN